MRGLRKHLSYANVVASLALFIALGGGALAASGGLVGSNGVIHGCVAKRGGEMTVVAAGRKCGHKQTAISFNQRGPQGLQGTTGTAGVNGVSVTSTALSSGNTNCAAGGSSFTAANGTTYACNGKAGQAGPPGPTAGAVSSGVTPSATPDDVLGTQATATVTTTAASKLLVTGWVKAGLGCNSNGSCTDTWGLYVDGSPVPNGSVQLSASASGSDSEFVLATGMTGTVAAGTHTIALEDNASANWESVSASSAHLNAVALG